MARLKDWKPVFIKALALSPNVAAAARKAGITRQAAYHTRSQDTEFSADWDDALGQAIEAAEGELYRRAVKGTITNRHYDKDGNLVGVDRQYSDTLLIFMLKAHKPEIYRETTRNELTGAGGKPIQTEQVHDLSKLSLDELIQLRAIVAKTNAATEP